MIALNEQARIGDCLKSLGFCDEIVVVDGGSTDATAEIARDHGARVLVRPFDDFARQHEFARNSALGTWILSLDADERATPELQRAAREIADRAAPDASAYALPFKNHLRETWLRHGGLWPDRHVRLYLRERAHHDLARPVHEKLLVEGPISQLDAPVIHLTWTSLSQALAKTQRYAETAARRLHQDGKSPSLLRLVARPLWRFVRAFVLRLGFLDGAPGAVAAFVLAHEAFVREAHLWELSRGAPSREQPQ